MQTSLCFASSFCLPCTNILTMLSDHVVRLFQNSTQHSLKILPNDKRISYTQNQSRLCHASRIRLSYTIFPILLKTSMYVFWYYVYCRWLVACTLITFHENRISIEWPRWVYRDKLMPHRIYQKTLLKSLNSNDGTYQAFPIISPYSSVQLIRTLYLRLGLSLPLCDDIVFNGIGFWIWLGANEMKLSTATWVESSVERDGVGESNDYKLICQSVQLNDLSDTRKRILRSTYFR